MSETYDEITMIAGRGDYPRIFAESARKGGVKKICAVAFKKETDPVIDKLVDDVRWVRIGQLGQMMEALKVFGCSHAVMVGQIKPAHLFTVRMDTMMLSLLGRLKERNAHTIFGAIGDKMKEEGVELVPAHLFMDSTMPAAGVLSSVDPTEAVQQDIQLGLQVAKATSGLDIGQTVVIKNGTVLAVEAFEGTDATILRAGKLGGPGATVVKVAKKGHDMRFDIPIIGEQTFKSLKRAGAVALAVEAEQTILLDKEKLAALADRQHVYFAAVTCD